MTHRESISAEFFERKYLYRSDPWRFATDPYELSRYASIIEELNGRTYGLGFEPGCSIGVLTEGLASLCQTVYAFDFSPTAVAQARSRCSHLANVRIDCRELDDQILVGDADLVVLSEIGYYFTDMQWNSIVINLVSQMSPKSTLLAAHWLGESDDHILSGDQIHQILLDRPELKHELGCRFPKFRLDRWTLQ